MDDKEKVRKALTKITKIMDDYKKYPSYYGYEVNTNKEYIDEYFDDIKNALLDSTVSDKEKVRKALVRIYRQLIASLDIGFNANDDLIIDLKKVKSILGQIPALEERYQILQRKSRDWAS